MVGGVSRLRWMAARCRSGRGVLRFRQRLCLRQDEPVGTNEYENVAGASAQREYDRRRAKDEQKIRDEWGRFGKIAVALSSERQSTVAWKSGARGEVEVGRRLDQLLTGDVRVLHDRRVPGSRANIDHIVVTQSGVTVVDAKRYVDKRPALEVRGGLFGRPRTEALIIGKSDKTALVEAVLKQVELVKGAAGEVPVSGALCFVDADWPLFGGPFTVRGVRVSGPKRLVKQLGAETGSLDVDATAKHLAERFRSA